MYSRFFRLFIVGFVTCALASLTVLAQGNSQGKGKGKGHDKQKGHDEQAEVYVKYGFQPRDREIVTTYYSKHGSGLPPGLAKRNGNLPPGLEKQLERNGLHCAVPSYPVPAHDGHSAQSFSWLALEFVPVHRIVPAMRPHFPLASC